MFSLFTTVRLIVYLLVSCVVVVFTGQQVLSGQATWVHWIMLPLGATLGYFVLQEITKRKPDDK